MSRQHPSSAVYFANFYNDTSPNDTGRNNINIVTTGKSKSVLASSASFDSSPSRRDTPRNAAISSYKNHHQPQHHHQQSSSSSPPPPSAPPHNQTNQRESAKNDDDDASIAIIFKHHNDQGKARTHSSSNYPSRAPPPVPGASASHPTMLPPPSATANARYSSPPPPPPRTTSKRLAASGQQGRNLGTHHRSKSSHSPATTPADQLVALLQEANDLLLNHHSSRKRKSRASSFSSFPLSSGHCLPVHELEGKLLSIVILANSVEKDILEKHHHNILHHLDHNHNNNLNNDSSNALSSMKNIVANSKKFYDQTAQQQQQQQQAILDETFQEKLAWLLNESGVVLGRCGPYCTNSHIRWREEELGLYQRAEGLYERIYGPNDRDSVNWAVCIMNVAATIIELQEEYQESRSIEQQREREILVTQSRSHSSSNNNNDTDNTNINNNNNSNNVLQQKSVPDIAYSSSPSFGSVVVGYNQDDDISRVWGEETENDVAILQRGINMMQVALAMHRRIYRTYRRYCSGGSENDVGVASATMINNEREYAACLRETGQTLARLGLFSEAVTLLQEHLALVTSFADEARRKQQQEQQRKQSGSDDHHQPDLLRFEEDEEVAAALNQLGYCFCEAKDYKRGIEYQKRAIEGYQQLCGGSDEQDDNDLATLKMNCGYYQCENGDRENGLSMMRDGIEMKRRLLAADAEYARNRDKKKDDNNNNSNISSSSKTRNGLQMLTKHRKKGVEQFDDDDDDEHERIPSSLASTTRTDDSSSSSSSLQQDYLDLARRRVAKLRPSETFAVMLWNCGLQYEKLQDPEFLGDALDMHCQALAMFRRVFAPPNDDHEWIVRSTDKVGRLMRVKAALMKERLYQLHHHQRSRSVGPATAPESERNSLPQPLPLPLPLPPPPPRLSGSASLTFDTNDSTASPRRNIV